MEVIMKKDDIELNKHMDWDQDDSVDDSVHDPYPSGYVLSEYGQPAVRAERGK